LHETAATVKAVAAFFVYGLFSDIDFYKEFVEM